MSFFPTAGLLMLYLQFGQLKRPTPRGPSKAYRLPRPPAEWLPDCKPCLVKCHFPRMTHPSQLKAGGPFLSWDWKSLDAVGTEMGFICSL